MRCPFCREDNDRVVDSRPGENGAAIRRRRECLACKRRFTTYERVEESPLKVVKKDGRREPYDRAKLKSGVEKACGKLPVSEEQREALVSEVESEIMEKFDREVPSSEIGERIMERLKKLNQVAYVRFASVYREFRDVSGFEDVLKEILKERPQPTSRKAKDE
ncbi:MAG: transcriptional regulator NrdR [Planctomycetota bacterium]|nr:transcriptional regulator NrdR [Planctomycetota bacterium]